MWETVKEGWAPKNPCFWTVVLEKTPESPLDCRGIKPVHPKGSQPWIFIGRTAAESEAPVLWPPDAKSWLIGIDPDAGKDWRQEEKGATEDEMVGWHHWLNGHEFEQTLGDSEGQGSLACCHSWGRKRFSQDWATEQQNSDYSPLSCVSCSAISTSRFPLSGPAHSYINVWLSKSFQINVWFFLLSHLRFYGTSF